VTGFPPALDPDARSAELHVFEDHAQRKIVCLIPRVLSASVDAMGQG
jgi:hypothetical protein